MTKPFESLRRPITDISGNERKVVSVAAQELTAGGQVIKDNLYAVLDDKAWCKRTGLGLAKFEEAIQHLKSLGAILLKRPSRRSAPGTTAIALLPRLTLGLASELGKDKKR